MDNPTTGTIRRSTLRHDFLDDMSDSTFRRKIESHPAFPRPLRGFRPTRYDKAAALDALQVILEEAKGDAS